MKEDIRSKTGKTLKDITLENILKGNISSEDVTISKETLLKQGEVAESHGRPQLRKNFERASELIDVPDDLILKVYELLRPNRATKKELLTAATMLRSCYNAVECAKFIEDAVKVYEKRGILRAEVE